MSRVRSSSPRIKPAAPRVTGVWPLLAAAGGPGMPILFSSHSNKVFSKEEKLFSFSHDMYTCSRRLQGKDGLLLAGVSWSPGSASKEVTTVFLDKCKNLVSSSMLKC